MRRWDPGLGPFELSRAILDDWEFEIGKKSSSIILIPSRFVFGLSCDIWRAGVGALGAVFVDILLFFGEESESRSSRR
jgi:hypothetical protein